MRLVIDLQGAQTASRFRGIGRYTLSLTQEIIRLRASHEVIIALNGAFSDTIAPLKKILNHLLPQENIRVWLPHEGTAPISGSNECRKKQAEIIYETFLGSLEPDVILITSLFESDPNFVATIKTTSMNIPTAVIAYDFIPLHYPDHFLASGTLWEKIYNERLEALSKAELLLAISDHTANDALNYLGVGNRELINISAACSDIFTPSQVSIVLRQNLQNKLGIRDGYIITSGNQDPHKNIRLLLQEYGKLSVSFRSHHQVVLIGNANSEQRSIYSDWAKKAGLAPNDLIVTGHLSDEELVALYTDAALMVFPSVDEGFGLPPLEAMSCGTPAIGSNRASIPEVIGMEAALFDPEKPDDLKSIILRAFEDEEFAKQLKENAVERPKLFTWARSATLAWEALEALHNREQRTKPTADFALKNCISEVAMTIPNSQDLDQISRTIALNFPRKVQKRRLFVDISTLHIHDARTGCQRVARSVLTEWLTRPPEGIDVIPVYSQDKFSTYFEANKFRAALTSVPTSRSDDPLDFAAGDVFFGLDLHASINSLQVSYLDQMYRMGVRVLFLVYDLLPLEMPEFFEPNVPEAFLKWVEVITRYDGIIGISQASVDAVKNWQSQNKQKSLAPDFEYHAVHLGADIENSLPTVGMPKNAAEVLSKIAASQSFLMTGTLEPRKGHEHALNAFEVLWEEGSELCLVIVGKKGWRIDSFAERLTSHPEFGKRLLWLEGISDEYLKAVYQNATCLLAASWGEGFGLPLIEAAHYEIPILARNLPVFREVAGEHAAYFDTTTPEGLAKAIAKWTKDYLAGVAPSSKNMQFLKWEECAKKMLEILVKTDLPRDFSSIYD